MINTSHCCYILPQFVLLELAEQGGAELRQSALQTLVASAQDRSTRSMIAAVTEQLSLSSAELFELAGAAAENKTVYDAQTGLALPGAPMRAETHPAVPDP